MPHYIVRMRSLIEPTSVEIEASSPFIAAVKATGSSHVSDNELLGSDDRVSNFLDTCNNLEVLVVKLD